MKFYRYLIYKLYSWGLKKKNDTPVTNVILTLTFVHYVQLLTIYTVLLKIFPTINYFDKVDRIYIGIAFIVFYIIHYLLIYNKKRWELYLEEFGNEDNKKRKKGSILVLSYLIGSIVLFFLLLPILFGF